MPDPSRVSPFSNGSQFVDWLASSCDKCAKAYDHNAETFVCDLEEALTEACVFDGTVSAEVAAKLGVPERTWSDWRCKAFVPLGELTGVRRNDLPGQQRLF